MATMKERLSEQVKVAMKSGDKDTVLFCRNLLAAIKKKEIDESVELDDAGVTKIISASMKQRQESLDQFRKYNREDLAVKEEAELKFLQVYMPAQMGEDEVKKLVDWAVTEAKATGPKDMGHVMKVLMPKLQGRADGKLVNQLVKDRLAQA
ncbi:MAG: GatB/YqeY domain-containing protein [Bdellovibrionota bacterium]